MSLSRKMNAKRSRLNDNENIEGGVNRLSRYLFGSQPSFLKSPLSVRSNTASRTATIFSENASFVGVPGKSKEALRQEALDKASSQLLDRLFHFLSMLPSPDEHDDEDFEELHGEDGSVSTNVYSHYSAHYKRQHVNSLNKSRGLTLPAGAIGWLAHRLCPEQNSANDSSSVTSSPLHVNTSASESIGMQTNISNLSIDSEIVDRDLEDRLVLLKWLLRKVTHLKVTTAAWPPDPPASSKTKLSSTFSKASSSFQDDLDMNLSADEVMNMSRNEDASRYGDDSSIASNDFSTNSFFIQSAFDSNTSRNGLTRKNSHSPTNILWHQLRSFPRVDMDIFPNLNVLILDSVPPEWIQNMNVIQEKLTLLSLEKGAVFELNDFLFPMDKHNVYNNYMDGISNITNENLGIGPNEEKESKTEAENDLSPKSDIYSKLTHLKLSQCALGEMSGLQGTKSIKQKGNKESGFGVVGTFQTPAKNLHEKARNKFTSNENVVEFQFSSTLFNNSPTTPQPQPCPPPLSRIPNLQTLSLSNNQIINPSTALSGLSSLPNLASIDLSFNYIKSMKNSYLKLGNIRTLILSNNKIRKVSNGLDRLFSLETLSLDRNRIEYVQDVAGLGNLPYLSRLDLWGNPFVDKDEEAYRVNVLSLFMQKHGEDDLPILDNLLVSDEELKNLETLDFGDVVKVDNINEKNKADFFIEGKDQISTENDGTDSESSTPKPTYDIDTISSTSSYHQSSSSDQISLTSSHDKGLNHTRVRRLKKSICANIENVNPTEFKKQKSEPSSFCTIGQSYSLAKRNDIAKNSDDSRTDNNTVIGDVIDNLTITNPYLIQKRVILGIDSQISHKEENPETKDESFLQNDNDNENDPKKTGGFDKSRFAFLTQNIDELDDDDDSQGDYNLLSMAYTMKIEKKDSNQEPNEEYVPLFDDDIDFGVDIDIDPDEDGADSDPNKEAGTAEEENKQDDSNNESNVSDDKNTITSIENNSDEESKSALEMEETSNTKESDSVLATNEAISNEGTKQSTQNIRDASLLEKLNKLLISPVIDEKIDSEKSHTKDDDDNDDSSSSVSTLGSLPSFSNKNFMKPISRAAISSFKEKKTSENISLIQELLADDDDDYWNDENSDDDSVQNAPLEPTSMFEGVENLNMDHKSVVAQYEFDFDLAEVYAAYDAPQKYADKPVSGNLDLYFRTYVFPLTIYDENDDEKNNLEKLLSVAIPRIQLCMADRDEIIDRTTSLQMMSIQSLLDNLKGGERYVRFWYDKVLPCGVAARSRIEPVFSKSRGFHGESLIGNGKHTLVSESQPIIILLSDTAIYFITVKYKKKRQALPSDNNSFMPTIEETSEVTFLTRMTKNGEERSYPSPLPVTSSFKDCNWPHALARHSISSLKRISIGFGFQRLTLHFQVYDDEGFSSVNFTYIIHTWNKKRTVSIIQALQSNNKGKNSFIIENDDSSFLESLAKSVEPAPVGSVLHYQILFQKWKRRGRNSVRRACVVTDTLIYLLDEDYIGDGSKSQIAFSEETKRSGNVELKCVDSAPLENILDVEASDQDPNELTIVIKAPSFLQKNHRWRLICQDREGAERLKQYIRNGME